ncbi:elongation factor P hydroxylase [Luminiphilus sp. nBUS_16]|uniref:elongation factor P hydroxylase n=1 Tax=Luminiphilus sp. nBUS_16 TaxID=3395315 RepID=UPI003EBBDEA5
MAMGLDARCIEGVFSRAFAAEFNTRLVGGADEPLYQPPTSGAPAEIYYCRDYARSALHEVAHWCVAGSRRRRFSDYGYWYTADGRDTQQQAAFFCVEAKPQALESFFCAAAGIAFAPSLDNLSLEIPAAMLEQFQNQLRREQARFNNHGLPFRAARFAQALRKARA